MDKDSEAVVRRFVDAINAHDPNGLAALMTEDHGFVDARDKLVRGREAMREGWAAYFSWFPDYRIEVDGLIARGNEAALFGHASGTFSGKPSGGAPRSWRASAAWRALVRGAQVAEWRVYCDVEPMLRSMGQDRFDSV
ncbi:MAG: nuclear transport factor 2 family protein [Planctomycetes bacterium]|nr:nuclear transport factor 2 family protein [Planctomycetota bacterium]